MAGRIRTIKPELLEDSAIAELSHNAFRLFIGAILLADDYGNLRADPRYLEGQAFWGCAAERPIDALLAELAEKDLLTRYTVRGQHYAAIRGWAKHQKVDHPGKPRVPGPKKADETATLGNPRETLANIPEDLASPRESLATDLRSPTPTPTETASRTLALTHTREGLSNPDPPASAPEPDAQPTAPPPPPVVKSAGKRTPAFLNPHAERIYTAMLRHPVLADVCDHQLANDAATMAVVMKPIAWLDQAIEDVATKVSNARGTLTDHGIRNMVTGFCKNASAPRQAAPGGPGGHWPGSTLASPVQTPPGARNDWVQIEEPMTEADQARCREEAGRALRAMERPSAPGPRPQVRRS
jgi:hypothetical protein